jgi:hypothetical protein
VSTLQVNGEKWGKISLLTRYCVAKNPEGTAESYLQPSLRDWTSLVNPTQHCVLGYSQPSLRDWWVLTQTLKLDLFSIIYGTVENHI